MTKLPLRVLFDSEVFGRQVYGGISRYYSELIKHLPRYDILPRLIAPLTFNAYLHTGRTTGFLGFRLPAPWCNRYTAHGIRKLLALSDRCTAHLPIMDIVHHTGYGRRLCTSVRRVVTVVDMIPERLPQHFPGWSPHAGKREACNTASIILAISEHTKRDVVALYPDLQTSVEVTPLAVDADYFRSRARGDEDGTILFVGDRHAYKGFSTFADATSRLLAEDPTLRVLCVGSSRLQATELRPYVELGVQSRVSQRQASDEDLPSIYRRSRVFVFPSHYEGFGLPILEAFASECPVVLANASCFPEIAGDAADYFEVGNPDGLLEALRRVVSDESHRRSLRERGRRRLSLFSWDRTAQLTASAYRRVQELHP